MIQELLPSSFTFGNYNAEIPFKILIGDRLLLQWLKTQCILGYCKEPQYKSLKDYVAILFDLGDNGEYWSHIPERVFTALW